MKTELRQKTRHVIVGLFLAMITVVPAAQAQFTINNGSNFGTFSVGQIELGLSTSGGVGPYTWTLESGTLPTGMSIRTDLPSFLQGGQSTAVFAGIATTPATYNFTIGVTDSSGSPQHTSKAFSIKISSLVVKDWFNLPDAFLGGVAYSHTLTAMRDGVPVAATWSGSGYQSSVTMTQATPGVITWTNHGLANDEKVTFQNFNGTGLPAPLSNSTTYYVRNRTTNTFEISLTQGGGSIAITSADQGGNTAFAMPPGLTLNSATGEISGTPTRAGFYNISFSPSEGGDNVGRGVNLSVFAVNITTAGSLPNATQNSVYSTVIAATGGGGMTFSASGLPGGLSIDSSTGTLSSSGNPVSLSPGSYSFNVTATSGAVSYSKRMSVNVVGVPPTLPRIQPYQNAFTDCQVGVACDVGVSVSSGGTAPFTWSQSGLPLGLSIRTGGSADPTPNYTPGDAEIFGNATVAGSYPVTITVTDSSVPALTATNTFTLKVSELSMSGNNGVTWTRGVLSTQVHRIIGGPSVPAAFAPAPDGATLYTALLIDGTPPAGVSLQGGPPLYSGTPTENGQFNTRLRFTRTSSGQQLESSYFFSVGGGGSTIQINTNGNLGTVFNGASYSNQLSACCTPNSINWTVGAGMPSGLSLSGSGLLSASSGTMSPGAHTFLVTATDSGNGANFGTKQFTMFVTANSITNSSNTLPFGNVLTPYGPGGTGVQLTSTIGGGAWSLPFGNYLPPGLGLSAGGLISGTPTQSGQYQFNVLVNSAGSVSTRTFTISIYPNGAFPPVNLSFGPNFGPFAVGVVNISISNTAASGGTGTGYTYSWSPAATPVPGMRIQNGPPFPTNGFSGAAAGIMGVVATPGIYNTSIRVTDSGNNFFDKAIVITVSPLTILTPSGTGGMPNGTRGVAYPPMTLVPYGLGPNYTWALTNGGTTPPPGLTIGASTGVISGTPTGSGTQSYNFNVTLTDNATSKSISIGHSMTVDGFAIPTPGLLPEGTVGVFYTQTFDGSGCTGTCGWSISGGTPGGVNFNTSTGVLSGTPTGTFSGVLSITRTSTGGGANGPVTKGFALQIKNALPQTLVITTASTFYSTVGSGGSLLLGASGGANGAYTWTLDSGTLPPGVSLGTSLITPGLSVLGPRAMAVGTYNFVMKVTDSSAAFVTKAFTWKVAAVSESYTSLPLAGGSMPLGAAFSQALLGLGGTSVLGTGSYLWTNTTPLPYGLAFDPNTGVLSGTPLEQPSSSSFPIQLTDTVSSATIISNVNINIATPSGTLNWAANANLGTFNQGTTLVSTLFNPSTAGGTAPYTVTALTALPAGFSLLSGNGLVAVNGTNQPVGSTILSGVPMTPGTYSFTMRVQDSAGTPLVRVRTFTFSVVAFTFGVGNTFPNAAVGEAYSQTLKTWSAGAVTWAPSANASLPPGLSVVAGVLTGTPTLAGSFTFNLDSTDASGVTRTSQFSLTVASIRITSALVLPVATAGVPYNYDFDVASGAVTWTLGSPLPEGLDFDFNTGVISGAPFTAGTFAFNVGATPTGGGTAEVRRFVLYVRFPNPSVLDVALTSLTLADATVNQVVSYALANSGGVAPYAWTVAGGSTLPPGLVLITADSLGSVPPNLTTIGGVNTTTNPGMTLLAGVPTAAGSYAFDLIVTDANAQAARRTFTLKVSPVGTIAGTPRNVTPGVAYSQQFTPFGGTPPYTFTTTAINSRQDMLPPGLNMSSTGLLAGTTTSTGTYIFNLVIADNASHTFTRRYTLTSANANGMFVSNNNPPDVSIGKGSQSFDPQLQMTNFSFPPAATWSLVAGTLPPGVSLINGAPFQDNDEYSVVGQPTTPGTFTFTLRATQVGVPSNTADHEFTWRIVPMQQVTPTIFADLSTELPPAHVGVFYTTTIKMAGGTPPYTFAVSPFAPILPAGMSLSSSGVLSGTPTSIGNSLIFPVVTDSAGSPNVFRSQALVFVVTPAATPEPLTFFHLDLPDATIGAPFNFPLDVALRGGTPPFTWNVQGGSSLAPGLALLPGANGASTYLGGVPTSFPPSGTFFLEAHDSAGQVTPVPVHLEFAQLSITPDSLPTGVVGVPYPATQFTAAGGTGPYQILVYPGADLPTGLTMSPTGLLQGTPTSAGNFGVFVFVADSTGNAFGDRFFLMAIDNPAGEAPAISLSPTPIQLTHTTGTIEPNTPISINMTSGTPSYGLSIAGIPGASLTVGSGTAPDTSAIHWDFTGVGVGIYNGILAVHAAGATNQLNQVPIHVTVEAPCSYGVNPTSGSAPAGGGFGSFSVAAAANCAWTAAPVASPWVTITSATSGSGPANITYSVSPNGGASARIGTIDVSGATYSITQFGTGCATSISPTSLSATAAGGTAVVSITASGPSCTWTASSSDYSLSAAGGTGSGSITVTIPSNGGGTGVVRNGTIAGQAFTVNQGGVGCSAGLSPTSAAATADGGSASVFVTTPGGCSYDTLVGPSWVTVTSGGVGGSGTTELVYSVQPSSSTVQRSGTLTIGGQPFQITQAGVACSVTVNTSQLGSPYGPAAGFVVGTIGVTTNGPDCAWSADSSDPWVTIAPSSGVGSGTINVSVTSNAAVTASRSADLTVAGQTFSVSQAGTTCTYGLQSSAGSVTAGPSLGTFGVVAPSVCSWSAASDTPSWLSVVSAGSGGSSNVLFSVAANATVGQRVGTITVTSTDANTPLVTKVYTVTQAPAACSYSLASPSAGPLTFDPSSGSVGFTPLNGCGAPTPLSYSSWVTNVAVSGSNITYDVLANPSLSVRAGSIQIGDQTFTITQQGNTCGFSLNAYGSTFSQPGGSGSVLASSTSNSCPTNPATDHTLFIHLGLLTGDATLYTQPFTVDPYNSLNINVRFGTITFGGRIFSVKQLSW